MKKLNNQNAPDFTGDFETIELNKLFREKRPFTYVLETNTKTGQKATFARRNEIVANDAAIIIGDVIHNLRASIDYAYWEATNAFA